MPRVELARMLVIQIVEVGNIICPILYCFVSGPLLVRVSGHYEVVGVISFGSGDAVLGCGDPDNAGVYADVAVMKSWIMKYVTDIPCYDKR